MRPILARPHPPLPSPTAGVPFEEFVRFWDQYGRWSNLPANMGKVGNLSSEFISFFTEAEDGARILAAHPDVGRMVSLAKDVMPPVTFLHTESLNVELASFLADHGFSREDCRRVRDLAPVNRSSHRASVEISDWARDFIRDREAFLFEFFPEYGAEKKS